MVYAKRPTDWPSLGETIKNIFIADCPTPPWIFLATAPDLALDAFVEIIDPTNWKDVFRLSTGRSYSHGGRREFVPGQHINSDLASKTGRFVFSLTAILDFAAFWFLVIAVLEKSLYSWSSNALKLAGCSNPTSPFFAKSSFAVGGWPAMTEWQIGPTFLNTGNPTHPQIGPVLDIPPLWKGSIAMAFSCRDLFSELPIPFDLRLREVTTGAVIDADQGQLNIKTGKSTAMVWGSFASRPNEIGELHVEIRFPPDVPSSRIVVEPVGRAFLRIEPPQP